VTVTLTHANGGTHAPLVSFVPLVPSGPVAAWPRTRVPQPPPGTRLLPLTVVRRSDTTTAGSSDKTTAPRAARWRPRWPAVDGDTVITWSMAATVALVAVDAAIVSYSHIYGLATGQWGSGAETGVQARLLPMSIDGVIAEASLVKLYGARHKTARKPRLATFMLWLGIVATVAANVTHGLPSSLLSPVAHMVIMALLSAWPAGAFIGSVEMAMSLVRDKRAVASASDTGSDTEDDSDSDTEAPETTGQGGGGGGGKPPVTRRRKTTPDPVAAAIKRGWGDDKIIAKLGVTKRTIQRRRKDLEQAAATPAAG
jgi:hypothetical protein